MPVNKELYTELLNELSSSRATLVAVSKTKPEEDIMELYELGQRDFGENYVQELVRKYEALPKDIRWHFIGHLQSNKVKYIAPFVHMIHGVDSLKLLETINKEGQKTGRNIRCLLQVHIAKEETKFGLDETEVKQLASVCFTENKYNNVVVSGLMGMASFTNDTSVVRQEFNGLKSLFDGIRLIYSAEAKDFNTLSMGMSADYALAIQSGSNLVRIGSMLFGSRN